MSFYMIKYITLILVLTARYFIIAGGYFYLTQKLFFNKIKVLQVNAAPEFNGQFNMELRYSLQSMFIFDAVIK